MGSNRIDKISKRIYMQGKMTLVDLLALEEIGINLKEYISEEEVSKGEVDYEKYASTLEYIRKTTGISKLEIVLTENQIASLINGGELLIETNDINITIRQSYMKDLVADMLVRKNRVMNTISNAFEY